MALKNEWSDVGYILSWFFFVRSIWSGRNMQKILLLFIKIVDKKNLKQICFIVTIF